MSKKKLNLGKFSMGLYDQEAIGTRFDLGRPVPVVPPVRKATRIGTPEPKLEPKSTPKPKEPSPIQKRISSGRKRSSYTNSSGEGLRKGRPGVARSREHRESVSRTLRLQRSKEFIVFAPGSTIGEYVHLNMKEYCKERGLCPYTLRGVAKGKFKQHRGYVCSFTKP